MHELCWKRIPPCPYLRPCASSKPPLWWHFNRVADVFVSPSSESASAFVPFNTMCDVSAGPLGRMRNACNVLLFFHFFIYMCVFSPNEFPSSFCNGTISVSSEWVPRMQAKWLWFWSSCRALPMEFAFKLPSNWGRAKTFPLTVK